MRQRRTGTAMAVALVFGLVPAGVQAQTVGELQQQINELKAAIAALQAEAAAKQTVQAALPAGPREPVEMLEVVGAGAPRFSGEGFRNFKIRGRLMADFVQTGNPDRIGTVTESGFVGDPGLGTTTEIRRARIGVEGEMEDFKYKLEADFRDEDVEIADALFDYRGFDNLLLTVGYQKTQASMEEQTSSLTQKFMERGGFTDAFALGRDLGVTAMVFGETWHWKTGVFSDGGFSGDDEAAGFITSSRAHYTWRREEGFLHVGGSFEYRDSGAQTGRFRLRPLLDSTDTRFIDTGETGAGSTVLLGGELAGVRGPFNFAAEYGGMAIDRPGTDGFLQGGFLHLGYFLTGEQRGYKMREGYWDFTKPARPLGKGGRGALEFNLGVDWVDLDDGDAAISGGRQVALLAGFTWIPITHVRFLVNFNHVEVDDSPTRVKLRGDGSVDDDFATNSFGLRAQIDW